MMLQRAHLIVLLVLYSCPDATWASGILFPRASETREVKSLDGVWDFKLSPSNEPNLGFKHKWFSKPLKKSAGETLMMPVPSSFNDVTARADIRDFVGCVWYERSFFVPANWLSNSGLSVMIRFGSVHYAAKVWVNGNLVMEHEGGHLPFQADITKYLKKTANRLTVAVNNTLDAHTIPQGWVTRPNNTDDYPPGYVINYYTFDFYNYAGIHRPVYLYTVPISHVDDILITTNIDSKRNGLVKFSVDVQQENSNTIARLCMVQILSAVDTIVKASEYLPVENCTGLLTVEKANLWWPFLIRPKPGYLYTLEVKIFEDKKGEPIDIYRLPFGIRTVTWNNASIFVNGEPFYFRGFGRHEDLNVRGKGLDQVMLVKDHNLMQWLGANSYRTSHYPYSEENLDLSDQLGIVVISESPAVNLEVFDKPLLSRHRTVMQELIKRDKNRACVLMWSLSNEARSTFLPAESYYKELSTFVKRLDQTRPITMVTNQRYNLDLGAHFMDIIAINRYFAWYSDTGRLELITRQMESEVHNWKKIHDKPIIVTEYGADAVAGLHSDPPSVWTEDYQVALMKENFKAFDKLRKVGLLNGEMIWNFADFATAQVYTRVNGNKKGIFTRERQPKASAHVLRKRYHKIAEELEKNYKSNLH